MISWAILKPEILLWLRERRNDLRTQPCVYSTGGTRPVFEQFSWLKAGSAKAALSRPTHQREPANANRWCGHIIKSEALMDMAKRAKL